MAMKKPTTGSKLVTPTYELLVGGYNSVTSVGTTAVALPDTNLSYRKEVQIQNLHASNIVYITPTVPEFLVRNDHKHYKEAGYDDIAGATNYALRWQASGSGTTEYYATSTTVGDPSMSTPLRVYGITSAGGSEAALTNGTVGSLNNLEWDFGDNDSLGYNTLYIRLDAGHPEKEEYLFLMSYTRLPDSSTNYGIRVSPYDVVSLTMSSVCRIFAIASAASTNVATVEYL